MLTIKKEREINLSLSEVLILETIRQRADKSLLDKNSIKGLLEKNLIEPIGRAANKGYILSKEYYSYTNQPAVYTRQKDPGINNIRMQGYLHLNKFKKAKIADFEALFNGILTREQTTYYTCHFTTTAIIRLAVVSHLSFLILMRHIFPAIQR